MGMESFVSATDLHGDRQEKTAVSLLKDFVEAFRPKWRIFKGDLFDFRAFRTGASKEEKMHSMRADFKAGMEFLDWYDPDVFIMGNHDQRLFDAVEKDGLHKSGPIADLASILIEQFEKATKKVIVLPYDKRKGVWSYSGLKFTHGFDGLDAASMAAVYGNVIYGHGHAFESAPAPDHDGHRKAQMVGSLAQRDMTYNRAQTRTLRQQNGWAYGAFLGGRRHEVMPARIEQNQVVYAEHLKVLSA